MPLWPYGVLCVCAVCACVRVQTEGVKRGQQPLRTALAVTLVCSLAAHAAHAAAGRSNEMAAPRGVAGSPAYATQTTQ